MKRKEKGILRKKEKKSEKRKVLMRICNSFILKLLMLQFMHTIQHHHHHNHKHPFLYPMKYRLETKERIKTWDGRMEIRIDNSLEYYLHKRNIIIVDKR